MCSYWLINILTVCLLSVFFAGILIPKILLIAFRKRLFDVPDARKIHHVAVPRLGGIAFKPVIFLSMALCLGINLSLGNGRMLLSLDGDVCTLAFGYCCMVVLYLVGMADDLIGIRYRAKFVIQILCGLMFVAGGLGMTGLYGLFGVHGIPVWLGASITVVAVVFIINSINLIDGIDGLASGLSAVALAFYGVSFFIMGEYFYSMLSFSAVGVLIPFFYYNVFGNAERGRKIFMGDTGSLTIGVLLCFLGMKLLADLPEENSLHVNPFVLAFSPLIVPCFDVVRVFIHRIRKGCNPFLPDKSHIHHKLLMLGMSHKAAMSSIVLAAMVFVAINLLLLQRININLILVIDVVVWTVAHMLLTKAINKKNESNGAEKY